MLETETVDFIDSFPSTHPTISIKEQTIIENLEDYFEYKYTQNFKIAFWIEIIIFLPQNLLNYVGLKKDSVSAKLLNAIYWLIGLAVPIFWSTIKSLIYNH
ncbi:hypothetical protein [Apilactobacillus timberlakei]|uniref:hypothetical protein n=1 Tax=Apilactobacillus timberlakei TaxID=2008380 RepID=UPI00112EAF88|nr:hypothetical protein [Apilactobacillus timberlakei]TPR16671.1 hypothetical protein DYZ95_07460 [Apilactobacillus timberlakei]